MKFECLFCPLPLEAVNVHRETWQHKRRPHFRPYKHKKAEHRLPCEYAGGSHRGTTLTGAFEVAYDQIEIPTKLEKMVRRLSGAMSATRHPSRLVSENEIAPDIRHEEYTSHAVEELCDVYFEKIRGHQKLRDQRRALEGLRLFLPYSYGNIGYANAFHYLNQQFLPLDYRIFFGAVKELVPCRDGYFISYSIPGYYSDAWKPVVAFLTKAVLDEFAWGHVIEHRLVQDKLNKTPWVFLYGHPRLNGQGLVIQLESAYWVHCAKHPCWSNQQPVYRPEDLQPFSEVLPKLFTRQRDEFQEKFPQAERRDRSIVNVVQGQLQQESLITQSDLTLPPSLTRSVSSSAARGEPPEQASTPLKRPTSAPLPERESVKNDNNNSWWKRICSWRGWRRKKL
jgi:hypothetical protein